MAVLFSITPPGEANTVVCVYIIYIYIYIYIHGHFSTETSPDVCILYARECVRMVQHLLLVI